MKDGKSLVREGDNRYHAIFLTDGDALFVSPSSLAVPLIALGAKADDRRRQGRADRPVEDLYQVPKNDGRQRADDRARRAADQGHRSRRAKGKNASYEARQKQAHDWPLVLASVNLDRWTATRSSDGRGSSSTASRRSPGGARRPRRRSPARRSRWRPPRPPARPPSKAAKPLSMNAYKVALTKTVVKRALLAAVGEPLLGGGLSPCSDAESNDLADRRPSRAAVPCRHLRSKGMYVYTDGIGRRARTRTTTTPSTGASKP